MNVSVALRKALALRGITQSELARRLNCLPAYVAQVVNEHRAMSRDRIAEVCEALELPVLLFYVLACEPEDVAPLGPNYAEKLADHIWAQVRKREAGG